MLESPRENTAEIIGIPAVITGKMNTKDPRKCIIGNKSRNILEGEEVEAEEEEEEAEGFR